jgi:hypothetical protein
MMWGASSLLLLRRPYRNRSWSLRFQHDRWLFLCNAAKLVLGDCSRKSFD